jgi:beta propeller repeat protein
MRRAALVPLVLAALAACADQATMPGPVPPDGARASASAEGSPQGVFVSEPQLVAYNEGGLIYGQNLPLPDLGGGIVVWQDGASGETVVNAADLRNGRRTQYDAVSGYAYPATSGHYAVWGDDAGTLYLRGPSGAVRTIGRGAGYTAQVSPQGRVAYVQFDSGVGNVSVYDAHTGQTSAVTHYSRESGEAAREVDVDGWIVAWSSFTMRSPYTTAIRMMDLRTGEERQVVHVDDQAIGGPSVSRGRIVWSDVRSGNYDVYLYDVASGEERQITSDPAGQFNARISGDLVVWEDSRNSTSHYFPMNDVYGFDLKTGAEFPVATGDDHQGWPRVDGGRVLWTQRANDRWEIRTAVVRTTGRAGEDAEDGEGDAEG